MTVRTGLAADRCRSCFQSPRSHKKVRKFIICRYAADTVGSSDYAAHLALCGVAWSLDVRTIHQYVWWLCKWTGMQDYSEARWLVHRDS